MKSNSAQFSSYLILMNAYLDNQIPLSWEFHYDLVTIINLDNRKLIDTLVERGQRRIFLLNGSIDMTELAQNNSYQTT